MSTAFSPWINDWSVIRYTSEDCNRPHGGRCGGCLVDIRPNRRISPNRFGEIWVTCHLFRHADEAKRFLALPPRNTGEAGLVLDINSSDIPTEWIIWRREPSAFGQPGGGWAGLVRQKRPEPSDPSQSPRNLDPSTDYVQVTECFYLRPNRNCPPPPVPATVGTTWAFPFESL